MSRIQVIGLPGAGKTTAIQHYLSSHPDIDIQYIDIRDTPGIYKAGKFLRKIQSTSGNIIAESACGVKIKSFVIKLQPNLQKIYQQLLERDGRLDEDYLSLLTGQMIPAHCTISVTDDLYPLLDKVFQRS